MIKITFEGINESWKVFTTSTVVSLINRNSDWK
jgi:hypothetical protein